MTYILPAVLQRPVLKDKSAQIIVDNNRHTVWVFPPKCAQTALRIWVGDDNVTSPATFEMARARLNLLHYRLVMSVRHPVDRLLSARANKFPSRSLHDLIELVSKHEDTALDIHLQSQMYLLTRLGRDLPDLALRVENLTHDCEYLPWMEDVPDVRNQSSWTLDEYNSLSDEDRDLLEYRYRADYDLYHWANEQYAPY